MMNIERNADPLDTASSIELIQNAERVAEHSRLVKQTQLPVVKVVGGVETEVYEITECETCGEEIGEGRLKAAIKNTLCIGCAEVAEKKGRNYR